MIRFYFKLVKTAIEVYQDPKNVYGDDSLSFAQVFQWFTHFEEGTELLEDDPCPGQPVSAQSNENVEQVCAIVM
jgi:hypothetical protein